MKKSLINQVNKTISNFIANSSPVVEASENELFFAERTLDKRDKTLWEKSGFGVSFEVFYKVTKLCKYLHVYELADDEYLVKLVSNARKLSARDFCCDSYLTNIKITDKKMGSYFLTNAKYERDEFFQYDMPDYFDKVTTPKLGFFDKDVSFPSVYEGNIPWVSVCPSELTSMKQGVENAHGKVLVLGLGLGWYAHAVSNKDNVSSVTVVELSKEIISLFTENVLPQFVNKDKVTVVNADAVEFVKSIKDGEYDYCYADIWENQFDGAQWYKKLKPIDDSLPNTEFDYWIEKEIKWFIDQED